MHAQIFNCQNEFLLEMCCIAKTNSCMDGAFYNSVAIQVNDCILCRKVIIIFCVSASRFPLY